ncbi:MAG: DUF4397 domain-containing protein [Phototrophicaceae bacterium]
MTRFTRIVINMIVVIMMLAISLVATSAQGDGQIRFVHVIPDAVPVDVYVNGTLAAKSLNYGEASGYITVPAGDHVVTATAAGLSAALWEQSVSVADASQTTFIASDLAAPQFAAFSDNLATTPFGTSRLAVIHALAGAPSVTVQLAEAVEIGGAEQAAGTTIVPEIAFGEKFGEFDLPAQTYTVDVLPVGSSDVVLGAVALSLTSNTSYMAVVYGTANSPQALLLSARTTPAEDTGLVRFVHGIVGAPTVDVLVNDTLIAPGLTPDNPTEHIALPAGDHDVTFVVAGSDEALGSTSITVGSDAQTVAAVIVDSELTLAIFTDDLSGVSSTSASASVLNTIDGATVTVTLADGTVIGESATGEQSDASSFDAIVSDVAFTLELDGDEGTLDAGERVFYGGVYYNIIVLDGSAFGAPSLLIAPSSIAQTLESAPNAATTTLIVGDPAPPAQAETSVEAVATEAPVVSQPVAPIEAAIVGEIALDPSANLNLRQFPSADALVLGQAPSGALLEILGREGIPVALVDGQEPPPEAETFVDPVLDLGEGQDLDPTQTWVRVLYNTPDGGQIEAWTLSQFLIITDEDGLVALRDLEPTAGNIPGETRNTDVTPPPPPVDIVTAEVINLNADASLNIRRNPSSDSEVLGQIPLGTVVELNGLLISETGFLLDSEWAFVSFAPATGGVVTGWVSTNFITYALNGESEDLSDLIDLGFIEEITEDAIGSITAGAAPVVAATPDPQVDAYVAEIALDPDANLNLRRTPDVQGEVLQQIPSGSFVIVSARTADAQWLQTSFEGSDGWVASQFVIVTFNGAFISDLTEIPVDTTVNSATAETTETP